MAVNETTSVDVKTLRPFKRFIMTLGLLPTSYLESMTYAELVMWFCNFLQEQVIPTVNNNAEAVIELQNWFNNLDVQDEIDNKLDEMVEEGTLQEIIADYLNSKAIFGFDTVADMKSATNLIDGSYAKTLGYHAKNDGGMATYKVREITNDDIVDDMLIIALSDDNLIGELILDKEVNPEQLGAYGDNVHDDKNAIQKLFDTDIKNIIMNKTYYISNSILLTGENRKIHGTGSIRCDHNTNPALILNIWNSEIDLKGTIQAKDCIKFRATENDDHWIQYVTLKNLYLDATDKCIVCERNSSKWINEIKFDNIRFSGEYGFYFLGDYNNAGYRFTNCGNETCNTAFIYGYNLDSIDIIAIRNAESLNKTFIQVTNRCRSFNISTSDPIAYDKIIMPNASSNKTQGVVQANIQNSGGAKLGTIAHYYNNKCVIEDHNYHISLDGTTDSYSTSTSTEIEFPNLIRFKNVSGGHTFTIDVSNIDFSKYDIPINLYVESSGATLTLISQYGTQTIVFNDDNKKAGFYTLKTYFNSMFYLEKHTTTFVS